MMLLVRQDVSLWRKRTCWESPVEQLFTQWTTSLYALFSFLLQLLDQIRKKSLERPRLNRDHLSLIGSYGKYNYKSSHIIAHMNNDRSNDNHNIHNLLIADLNTY